MWKRIFLGASRRFDVANIAANEGKKKQKQHMSHSSAVDDESSLRQRAFYLNQLKRILLQNEESLDVLQTVLCHLSEEFPNRTNDSMKYALQVTDVEGAVSQASDAAVEIRTIGEQLSVENEDDTVYSQSSDVCFIHTTMLDLAKEMQLFFIDLDRLSADEFFQKIYYFQNETNEIRQKIKPLYHEMTKMNITHRWDRKTGQQIIDYND